MSKTCCAACGFAVMKPSWVGMEEGAEECGHVSPTQRETNDEQEGSEDDDLSPAQKLSFVTGRSLLESVVWLLMRLRLRFILDRSLSKTSPDRSADTKSSNSPPSSSPFALAFRAFRSFSLCSFSWGQRNMNDCIKKKKKKKDFS